MRISIHKTIVLVSLLPLLGCLGCGGAVAAPPVVAGALDLSAWSFERQGIVRLEGDWEICWNAFVPADSEACPTGAWESFPVPRLWSDAGVASPIGTKGIASYRLKITLPEDSGGMTLHVGSPLTAYRLWLNAEPRGGAGSPAANAGAAVPKLEDRHYSIPGGTQHLDVLVHVSNHEFRGGGLRRTWYLGLENQITTRNGYELLLYAFFMSTSVIVGLIFLAQFAFRPSEKARGWLGLFATLVGLRIIPGSTSELYQLMGGWASFEAMLRLEYANTALLIFAAAGYLGSKVPDVIPPSWTRLLQLTALALLPFQTLASVSIVLSTLPVILVLSVLAATVAIVSYARAYARGREGVGSTLLVISVFGVGVVHDVFRTQTGLGAPIELFPYFVVLSIAGEAASLLRGFARTFETVEQLSNELQESNFELQETEEAVVRFVPFHFLRALGKESIREVRPGDHVSAEMTVMSFQLDVSASEAEAFAVVDQFVGHAAVVIEDRGGFFSQQLGDRMLALFPGDPDEALAAATSIQRAVAELTGASKQKDVARVRIGIASGRVVLGAVGGHASLSGVAVGPAVSAARALQERAAEIDAGTLVAASTRDHLSDASRHELRGLVSQAGAEVSNAEDAEAGVFELYEPAVDETP